MIGWGWLVAAFMGGTLFGFFIATLCWISRSEDEQKAKRGGKHG